ncbi:MAG: hypothetical protein WBD17_08570 [Candidatus Omnitrophota bacterium]
MTEARSAEGMPAKPAPTRGAIYSKPSHQKMMQRAFVYCKIEVTIIEKDIKMNKNRKNSNYLWKWG